MKPCIVCGLLGTTTRCEQHKLRNGSTRQERKQRERIFARDGYRCTKVVDGERCTETTNLHSHHVVPVVRGGSDDDSNRTTRCAYHNLAQGARLC